MSPSRCGAAVLLAVLVAVPGAVTVLPAAAGTTLPTVVTVLGGGSFVAGHDSEVVIIPSPGAVTDYQVLPGVEGIGVSSSTSEASLGVTVSAPFDRPKFQVGTYTSTRHGGPGVAIFDVGLNGRGCYQGQGTFDVREVTRDTGGRLTGLALDYSTACAGETAQLHGSLRWNSTLPWKATTTTPFHAPEAGPGVTSAGTIVLRNAGTTPQSMGATTWEAGPETLGAPPVVTRDGCAGSTLPPGASCVLEVSVTSDGLRDVRGHLWTADTTRRGRVPTEVSMTAVPAPQTPVVTVRPVRGGVELSWGGGSSSQRVLRRELGAPGAETVVATGVRGPWTDSSARLGARYAYRVVSVSGGLESAPTEPVVAGALPVPVGQEGTFVPLDPVRVLDTRTGLGGRSGRLGQQGRLTFDPGLGRAIPASGVQAVLLNVTGTEPTRPTHVRVWPAGDVMPGTSSLNLLQGQSRANQVVVPVGRDGQVALYNDSGSTHLVVDVQGFYSTVVGEAGGGFHPLPPGRVLDTREGGAAMGPGEEYLVPVGTRGVDWTTISAVDVNVTVTSPTTSGHVTAWPGDLDPPVASTVNFSRGQTVANHAVVPVVLDEDTGEPYIALRNSSGRTHLVLDVLGYYDDGSRPDGLRFSASSTRRVADSRQAGARVPAGGTLVVPGSVLPPAVAHVLNVTATGSTGAGHLTAWSGEGDRPTTSTVNFARGEDSPNLATVLAGPDGRIAVTANSSPSHVVVDHLGYFW